MSTSIIPLMSAVVAGAVGYQVGKRARTDDSPPAALPEPENPPDSTEPPPPVAEPDQEPWLDSVQFEALDQVEDPPDVEPLIRLAVDSRQTSTSEVWEVLLWSDGRIQLVAAFSGKRFISTGELPARLVSGLQTLRDTMDGNDLVGYCVLNSTHDVILLCCRFADEAPLWQRVIALHVPTARHMEGAIARVVCEPPL